MTLRGSAWSACCTLQTERRRYWLTAVIGLLGTLTACGGGDSSSSNAGSGSTGSAGNSSSGATNSPATLEVSPAAVNVTAPINGAAPQTIVQVSVLASSSSTFYVRASVTKNGVASETLTSQGSTGALSLQFKQPSSLSTGTYADSVVIEGCYDTACSQQISSSPQKIPVTYIVTQALPQAISLTPASVTAGARAFTLTVGGSGFQPSSNVLWNGAVRATTYVNGSQLTAQITQADVASTGSATVVVATGAAQSAPSTFTIALPSFVLTQLSPKQVTAGGGPFYLTAFGNGFTAATAIAWNGQDLTTTYVSATVVRALVPSNQIASVGTAAVTIVNPQGQGGISGALTLKIVAPTGDAVSYQMNAAHTGAVTFNNLVLPASSTWSVDVGGTPSYALVVGGHVFVTVGVNGNSQLLALDGSNGTTLWGPIAFSGYANAAYDDGRLFLVSGTSIENQTISAVDPATGNSLWSAAVPGSWFPEPPVAADGIVYTTNGGFVSAFDETSGARLWSIDLGGTSGIVAVTNDGVYSASPCTAFDLQPAAGSTLWFNNSGCSGGGGATSVVADGVLYAPNGVSGSSGEVFNAETGQVAGSYSADAIPAFSSSTGFFLTGGTLQGLARTNNQVLWSFTGDGNLSTAPIVVDNYVFIGSGGGKLYGLDSSTGQQVWSQNLGAPIPPTNEATANLYTGLAAGDGLLIVPNGTKVTAYTLSNSP